MNHYRDWDSRFGSVSGKTSTGISCTGIWRWPEWVNAHPAEKLIVYRDFKDIQRSLISNGFPTLDEDEKLALDRIQGSRVHFNDLFEISMLETMWSLLSKEPFDERRAEALVGMNVDPHFPMVKEDPHVKDLLFAELAR
jgi:hypothetical protein